MDRRELPGYRLEFADGPEKPKESRTSRYTSWLGQRMKNKAELNEIIYGEVEEPIDVEELKKAPLFDFGKGFTGHPPVEYKPGEEPAFAPMSREQMRLLLVRVIPAPMIPFVLEHFTFDFDIPDNPEAPPTGPTVQVKNDKVNITFYRSNFFTKGTPPGLTGVPERAVAGFIDPAKLTIFLGKIIGNMIDPPEEWPAMAEKGFALTYERQGPTKRRRRKKLPKELQDKMRLDKQWRDFVALSITSPDLAKQRYPEAYDYLQGQFESFSDIRQDKKAISTLQKNMPGGMLQLSEFNVAMDIRTEDEKANAAGLSPQLAWYDKFVSFLNRGMALFGRQIILNVPEDPARAEALAEDDKVIKNLLETTDENLRDVEFAEIVANAKPDDPKARDQARRYLLAASQAGELANWRIYAWLYKFSPLFRQTKGKQIGETDFKDLQLIYNQSDKVGNRLGTGVLPFKAIPVTLATDPNAKYYGRKMFLYVRNGNYAQEVEKKVRSKNPRAIFEAIPGVIKQFEKGFAFDEKFNTSPEGMRTASGSLEQLFGEQFGKELGQILGDLQVDKISPDAKAVAMAYFDYYKQIGQKYEKDINPAHFATLRRYEDHLNRPPEAATAELETIPAADVARSEDVNLIVERQRSAIDTEKKILHTVGIAADRRSNLSPDIQGYLLKLLEEGHTEPAEIMDIMRPVIAQLFATNKMEAAQEDRNLFSFLHSPVMRKSLDLLKRTKEYERKLLPTYTTEVEATIDYLKSDKLKPGDVLPDSVTEEQFAAYQKYGIKLDRDDIEALKAIGSTTTAEGVVDVDDEATKETANLLEAEFETAAKNKERARILNEKVKAADDRTRRLIVVDLVGKANESLNAFLAKRRPTDTYHRYYKDWLKSSGRIMNAAPLQPVARQLEGAVRLMDNPAGFRVGLERKDSITTQLSQAINYEKVLTQNKKEAPKEEPKEEEA